MMRQKNVIGVPDASEDLRQGEATLRLECDRESDTLVMTFAVFPAADGKPRFDFVRATLALNAKRVFLRDNHEMWYQKGTPSVGNSVPEIVAFLRTIIERERVKRVIAIGNSGGGFAAILFGVMLGVDEIQAFNPPTRLLIPNDTSAPDRLLALQQEYGPGKPFMDLKTILESHLISRTHITIHYSRGDKTDRRHARYLMSFPNVCNIQYPIVTHHLARFYTDRGLLAPLLAAVVEGDEVGFRQIVRRAKIVAALHYPPERIVWFFEKAWSRLCQYAHQFSTARGDKQRAS